MDEDETDEIILSNLNFDGYGCMLWLFSVCMMGNIKCYRTLSFCFLLEFL